MPLKSSYVEKSWVGMYKVKKRITDLDMTDHIAMNNAKGQEVTTVTRDKVVLENVRQDINIKLQKGRQKLIYR